jgi:hypothetical protein
MLLQFRAIAPLFALLEAKDHSKTEQDYLSRVGYGLVFRNVGF